MALEANDLATIESFQEAQKSEPVDALPEASASIEAGFHKVDLSSNMELVSRMIYSGNQLWLTAGGFAPVDSFFEDSGNGAEREDNHYQSPLTSSGLAGHIVLPFQLFSGNTSTVLDLGSHRPQTVPHSHAMTKDGRWIVSIQPNARMDLFVCINYRSNA